MKNLTLLDRIMIQTIFPESGNRKEITIRKDINEKVKLTQSDFEKYEMVFNEKGGVSWNQEGAKAEFPIEFTKLEEDEIVACLKSLDTNKKLKFDHDGLCNLFDI